MNDQMNEIVNMIDNQVIAEEPEKEEINEEAELQAGKTEEEKQTEESSEERESSIETITELAKELDIEPEELYGLRVPMPGGTEAKTIGEIKDEYNDFVQQKRQFDAKIKDYEQKIQSNIQPLQGQAPVELSNQIEQAQTDVTSIESSYQQIDWTKFEQEDPGNAALQKQKFQEAYNTATGKVEQLQQQVTQARQQNLNQVIQGEQQKLSKLVPEWSDRDVAQKESTGIQTIMAEYGFLPEEIHQVIDARQVKMLVDFMRLKAGLKNASPSKVKEKSKTLRSGSLQLRNRAKDTEVSKMISSAKKSRDPRVHARAISQLLNGE